MYLKRTPNMLPHFDIERRLMDIMIFATIDSNNINSTQVYDEVNPQICSTKCPIGIHTRYPDVCHNDNHKTKGIVGDCKISKHDHAGMQR